MPILIEHIDSIARKLQRDVLYIAFDTKSTAEHKDESNGANWRTLKIRQHVVNWLDSRMIEWRCCGHYADVNSMISYQGQIFVDVPFDQDHPVFQELTLFLENPDGSMQFPNCTFYYCKLDAAMKNSAHDEPGFWKNWAEMS